MKYLTLLLGFLALAAMTAIIISPEMVSGFSQKIVASIAIISSLVNIIMVLVMRPQ